MKIKSKRPIACLLAGLISLAGITAAAADVPDYYAEFGGHNGMTQLTDRFVDRLLQDQRIAGYFAKTDIPNLKEELALQFCMVLHGPCTYDGPDMQRVHRKLGVTEAAFNALDEDLVDTMQDQHVPIDAQNALLKQLAPMEHQVVTR